MFSTEIRLLVLLIITTVNGHINLTPYVEKGEVEKARSLSTVAPALFAGAHSHAAYFTVNKTAQWDYFFWYFPVQNRTLEETPWIIWLPSETGMSALYGLFGESIGPLKYEKGKLEYRPVSWGTNYSLLFIDCPAGAGFSTAGHGYAVNEDQVGSTLLSFIQQFLQVFPELRKARLFIAGESYAGKYVPAFAHYIHKYKNESQPINLEGIAIGNGWIDPPSLLHYGQWAVQIGLVSPDQGREISAKEDKARAFLNQNKFFEYEKEALLIYSMLQTYTHVNMHNYLKNPSDKLANTEFASYLVREDVRRALHAYPTNFDLVSNNTHWHLTHDYFNTTKPWFEELLDNYRVLVYSGHLDLTVAYASSIHTYKSLKWSGAEDYKKAKREMFQDKDHIIGYKKKARNLLEVMLRNAAHNAAADQPQYLRELLTDFINNSD